MKMQVITIVIISTVCQFNAEQTKICTFVLEMNLLNDKLYGKHTFVLGNGCFKDKTKQADYL